MSITADKLSATGSRGRELDAVVRDVLVRIDDALVRADRVWGRNVVTHELESNYNIPGLGKKAAQRVIYSTVVRSLRERGFTVRLVLEPDRSRLLIEWVTDLSDKEIDAMNRLIREVRLEASEVSSYLAGGPRSASS
jgi:hypothetical protein